MRAEELRHFLDRRPFQAIRLHISSGQHVDITHPEAALVSRSLVAVAVGGAGGVAEFLSHYNLLHVVKIEILDGEKPARRRKTRRD